MSLVKRVTTRKAKPRDYAPLGRERVPGYSDAIVVDGEVQPLDGQPPVARSNGWGDMSWTRTR